MYTSKVIFTYKKIYFIQYCMKRFFHEFNELFSPVVSLLADWSRSICRISFMGGRCSSPQHIQPSLPSCRHFVALACNARGRLKFSSFGLTIVRTILVNKFHICYLYHSSVLSVTFATTIKGRKFIKTFKIKFSYYLHSFIFT